MKFTSFSDFLIVLFMSSLALVFATPVHIQSRSALDVFVPPIIQPDGKTVWKIGSTQVVSWDTSNAPTQITNPLGQILLRKGQLTTNTALASGFQILSGQIEVQVPDVAEGDDYSIVLFGDSGNISPNFDITR